MNCARNIITANFSGGGTSATTAPLWQWDYGQVLCITGIEDLPAAFEVHFSTNKTGGVSTVAVGADGQVTIPNVLLTIGKNLNAWIYLSDSEGEGETEYSILIPVKARPMPETYDAEVTGEFDDVVRQVSEYAQTAQTAADNAGASASAAAASADSAAASASAAETAKTAAETAQGKAEDAQAAAETAAQTATDKASQTAQDAAQAASDAGRAESAADRAEAAQTGAESAKADAETAAQGAADSASTASASATSAGQAASAAAQSATAAAGSVTTAGNAAQTATTKAAEAFASADAAAASETAAQTAQTAAESAATNAGQSASTATTKAAEAAQSASNAAASETAAEAAATRAETAAASIVVDDALSDTSTNPVENRVITTEVTQVKNAIREVEDATLVSRNLWEGTTLFGVRTQANGTQLAYSEAQAANYKTAKVKIQPGKTYTIVRSGSSYLGSLTASQDIDAAYIAANTPVTPTNYHVIRTSTTASPSYVNFTADANAEYLYICYTITGEAAQIAVYEGTYTGFQHDPTFYKKSETYSSVEIDSIVSPYNAAVSFLGLDKNLWDGTVFDGVRTQASGTQLAYSEAQAANYKTAKVKIEPNTAYSIIRANSSYLGALTSSQDISLTDVIATNPTTPANYKVIRTSGTASPTYVNFTSDTNAEYLYICYTLTGEDADIAVYEGTYTDFQGANVYTKAETDALVTGKGSVYGTGDNIYVRCGKMLYNVAHIVNASIHADLWRVYSGAIVTEDTTQYLWNGQDADGVVQIAGEDDFIGGFHGDEILTDFKLFIDGVEQQTYTFDSVNFDEIVIYQESDVYHCNTSDLHDTVAFKRNKVIVFNKDGMTIKNYWKAQESLQLTTAYFGMLSVQKMQTDGVSILNNGYYTNADYAYKGNETGTPNSPDLTEVVFNTALGDVGIKMKDVTAGNYKGNVSYYSTGEVRLKTYMGPIIASNSNPVTVNENEILKGEAMFFCN